MKSDQDVMADILSQEFSTAATIQGGWNYGDAVASGMQVRAMKSLLTDGFAGFAQAWNEGFVKGRRTHEAQEYADKYNKAAHDSAILLSGAKLMLNRALWNKIWHTAFGGND